LDGKNETEGARKSQHLSEKRTAAKEGLTGGSGEWNSGLTHVFWSHGVTLSD